MNFAAKCLLGLDVMIMITRSVSDNVNWLMISLLVLAPGLLTGGPRWEDQANSRPATAVTARLLSTAQFNSRLRNWKITIFNIRSFIIIPLIDGTLLLGLLGHLWTGCHHSLLTLSLQSLTRSLSLTIFRNKISGRRFTRSARLSYIIRERTSKSI